MIDFRIFGIEFGVSVGFFGVLTLMQYLDNTGLIIPTYFAVLFHEAGHLVFMRLFNRAPKRIVLRVGAANIEGDYYKTDFKSFIIYLAGPAVNFITSLICFFVYTLSKNPAFLKNCLVMLSVGIFNLIPAVGLDGGSMLYFVLSKGVSSKKAELALKIISIFISVTLVILGLYNFCFQKNFSLALMGIYLLAITLLKK